MIYLDNAATTMPYLEVIDNIREDLCFNWGNASTTYKIGREAKTILEESRERIAGLVGASPEEIYFTSGSSEGNAWAIAQGEKCLCSQYEHHNITENKKSLIVDENYLALIRDSIKSEINSPFAGLYKNFILSWMAVNNETGEIFSIYRMGQYAKELGMKYHCDLTQAIGNIYLPLHKNSYIDIATASAHKFGGPKGVGFIYFNKDSIPNETIKPLIYGGGQEKGVRAGTENIPYIHGMATALDITMSHLSQKIEHCRKLKAKLIEEIIKNFNEEDYYLASPANSIVSTLNVCFRGVESEILAAMLDDAGIYVNTGSACNDGSMKNSAVLEAMKVPEEYIRGPIRFSFNLNNTESEIVKAVECLKKCYNELTKNT